MRTRLGAAALAALPTLIAAETDIHALTDAERAAFGAEVRATLLAHPEIVGDALERQSPVQSAYRQMIDDDLSLLARIAPEILGVADIALFTGPDCPECADALAELAAFSKGNGTTFIHHDIAAPEAAAWAEALELDSVPFYVLPEIVLRGQMPAIVLQKYLAN